MAQGASSRERRAPTDPRRRQVDASMSDPKLAQLISHLQSLGLGYLTNHIGNLPAWASREGPSHTALLEHLLGQEVASKCEAPIERRTSTSGLPERKTLEAFDSSSSLPIKEASRHSATRCARRVSSSSASSSARMP